MWGWRGEGARGKANSRTPTVVAVVLVFGEDEAEVDMVAWLALFNGYTRSWSW
jgi:hypothetical protein